MAIQTGQTVHTHSGQTVHLNIQTGQTVHTLRTNSTPEYSGRTDSNTFRVKQSTWIFRQVSRSDSTYAQVKRYTRIFRQVRQYIHTLRSSSTHEYSDRSDRTHVVRSSRTHGHSGRSDSTHAEGQTVHTHEYSGRSDSTHAQVKQYTSMSTLSRHF